MSALKSAALCSCLTVAALSFAGCESSHKEHHHHDHDSMMSDTTGMSRNQMLQNGDEMIRKGEAMRHDAMQMTDAETRNGMRKQEMMMKGDQMVNDGQAMKDKAMRE